MKFNDPSEFFKFILNKADIDVINDSQKCLALALDLLDSEKFYFKLLRISFDNNVYKELIKAYNADSNVKTHCIDKAIKILNENCFIEKEKAVLAASWLASLIYPTEWSVFQSNYNFDSEDKSVSSKEIIKDNNQNFEETNKNNLHLNTDSDKMVKRAMLALEDGDFDKADDFAEKALDLDPENANAYLVKLLVECKVQKLEDLATLPNSFDENSNFKKVIRFADKNLKDRMNGYVEENRKYLIYKEAVSNISDTLIDSNLNAINLFKTIADYNDSKDRIKECENNISQIHYDEACNMISKTSIDSNISAIKIFESIIDFEDSRQKIEGCNKLIFSIKEKEKEKEQRLNIYNEIINNMVDCPAGEFLMGSPIGFLGLFGEFGRDNDELQHKVIISRSFKIGKYPVTQKEYEAVMGNNPSKFRGENSPVECVSWNDAMKFCDKLNKYAKNIPQGYKFDLPTEAQWEYACRAGTTTSLNSGKNITSETGSCYNLDEVGWYVENSSRKTDPVGQKKPNAWGIYDMHGNVCELCKDWKGDYPSSSVTDPTGATSGSNRVCRGGGWYYVAGDCRSAFRYCLNPDDRDDGFGFRLALVPLSSTK